MCKPMWGAMWRPPVNPGPATTPDVEPCVTTFCIVVESVGVTMKPYFGQFFKFFFGLFWIFDQIFRFLVKIIWFLSFSGKKWCRIIMSFRQNTIFGPETCQIGPKVWDRTCPDLPRLVLLGKFIIFLEKHWFYQINLYFFYEIIGFTKRIYHIL